MWPVIQILLLTAITVFMVSQVIYPAFSDKPFFWTFRKSYKDLREAKTELKELEVEEEAEKIKAETKARKMNRQESADDDN